jgi:hypothetical protein
MFVLMTALSTLTSSLSPHPPTSALRPPPPPLSISFLLALDLVLVPPARHPGLLRRSRRPRRRRACTFPLPPRADVGRLFARPPARRRRRRLAFFPRRPPGAEGAGAGAGAGGRSVAGGVAALVVLGISLVGWAFLSFIEWVVSCELVRERVRE